MDWSPGVMQADFGLAQAVVAGSRTDVHCLVVSFPYSNMRYAVALPGRERGVRAPWGCSGCSSTSAPCRRCWCPDDATGAAHRVSWDRIVVVEVFQRFVAHHRIEAVEGLITEKIIRAGADAEQHRDCLIARFGMDLDVSSRVWPLQKYNFDVLFKYNLF